MVHLFGTFTEFYLACALIVFPLCWELSIRVPAYYRCNIPTRIIGLIGLSLSWPILIFIDVMSIIRGGDDDLT